MNFYTANASMHFNAFTVRRADAASCICSMVRRVLEDPEVLLQDAPSTPRNWVLAFNPVVLVQVVLLYGTRDEALLHYYQHNSMHTDCQAAQLNHVIAERWF